MPIPSTTDANGIWDLGEVRDAVYNGTWPATVLVPSAPTLTALDPNNNQITATFSAPSSDGGRPVTQYIATANPGGFTGTGASSPVTITGLTNGVTYTVTVAATNAVGTGPASNSLSVAAGATPNGQQAYVSDGTYSWVAPAGVTRVCAVAVGGGAGRLSNQYDSPGDPGYNNGGGGGGLAWRNNMTVVPGSSYTVIVGRAGPGTGCQGGASRANGGNSSFTAVGSSITANGGSGFGSGGGFSGQGGGSGGSSSYSPESNGAGGAGGYSGSGGNGGTPGSTTGKAGSGGGGSGGGFSRGNGGGVGILGEGSSGAQVSSGQNGNPGSGGSGVTYGGGGGSFSGGVGAVRIIWGNNGGERAFPSTRTGDL